jgi:hypothetical protein
MCVFTSFLNSRKYDIGLAAKLYRQTWLDGGIVSLVALQTHALAVAAVLRATKDYSAKRPDCARSAWSYSRTWDMSDFRFVTNFCDTIISDHCDTERSFRTLKYNKNHLRSMTGEEKLTDLLIST